MKERLIELVEKKYLKPDVTKEMFKAGDTISVYYKVVEGNKERIQVFEGIVIRISGAGIAKKISL